MIPKVKLKLINEYICIYFLLDLLISVHIELKHLYKLKVLFKCFKKNRLANVNSRLGGRGGGVYETLNIVGNFFSY